MCVAHLFPAYTGSNIDRELSNNVGVKLVRKLIDQEHKTPAE